MRLRLTFALLLTSLCVSLSAQGVNDDYVIDKNSKSEKLGMIYGVMGGITMPKMSDRNKSLDVTNTVGYAAGLMYGVDLGGLEIVPEIWYQYDRTSVYNKDKGYFGDLYSHSIEVPVLAAIEMRNFRFNFGPSFSLMSNSRVESNDFEDVDFGRVKSTVGYVLGVSYTLFDHVIFDVRYTGRFVSSDVNWFNSDETYDYRYYNFGFNVGYRF